MGEAHLSGHIVICGWNSKGPEILRELHADEVKAKTAGPGQVLRRASGAPA